MPAAILKNLINVKNRLHQLGWTREQLIEVVAAMVSARNDTTENDPSSAPGWMAWKDGTRRLREIALPMGWQRDETNNVPSVINPELALRVTVCNTDDGTCVEDRIPKNRTKKGPATDRSVSENTGWLFSAEETPQIVPLSKGVRQPGGVSNYVLCVYHEGDEVRAEFSCPMVTSAGYYADFVERIFLITSGDDFEGNKVTRATPELDDVQEYDIPVKRK